MCELRGTNVKESKGIYIEAYILSKSDPREKEGKLESKFCVYLLGRCIVC